MPLVVGNPARIIEKGLVTGPGWRRAQGPAQRGSVFTPKGRREQLSSAASDAMRMSNAAHMRGGVRGPRCSGPRMGFGARAARTPGSSTLPEAAVCRRRRAEALDPPAHPRLPPPLPLDVATVLVAASSAAGAARCRVGRDGSPPRKPPAPDPAERDNVALAKITTDNPTPCIRKAALPRRASPAWVTSCNCSPRKFWRRKKARLGSIGA